jgi:hypothetical protein
MNRTMVAWYAFLSVMLQCGQEVTPMTTVLPTEPSIVVSLSPQQRQLVEQAAAQHGQSPDAFAAATLVEKAQQVVRGGTHRALSTEGAGIEPNGILPSPAPENKKRRFESGELLENAEHVILNDRALINWRFTPSFAQEYIRRTLEALAGHSTSDWPQGIVEPWQPTEQIYALHLMVGPDHLLVFFRPEGPDIRLLDLALKEVIDRYFTPKSEAQKG